MGQVALSKEPQKFALLVEDISGKGHLSKSVGGKMRRSIFVPID